MTSSFAHVASVLRVTTRCTASPFFTSILLGSNPLLVTARSMVRAAGAAASRVAINMAFMSLLLVRVAEGPGPSRRGTARIDDKLQHGRGESRATARMARPAAAAPCQRSRREMPRHRMLVELADHSAGEHYRGKCESRLPS